jgi:hypothetical protein
MRVMRYMSVMRKPIPSRYLLVVLALLVGLLAFTLVTEAISGGVHSLPAANSVSHPVDLGNGKFVFTPTSAHVTPGVAYRFSIFTHCPLTPADVDFDGSFWDPAGPTPVTDGYGGGPPGFEQPSDQGVMTLVAPDRAEYRSQKGEVMRFTRHPGTIIASMCS